MLRQTKDLKGYKLSASDGEIGKVKEFYFDDQSWAVRYLVADTGGWLSGRQVLISPYALDPARTDDKIIPVDLTRKQIENSPSLDADKPVSRQYEMQYYPYYGWPGYWGGPYMWGSAGYPVRGQGGWSETTRHKENDDPHLRSTQDVTGRTIQAQDGVIGDVEDFVVDDETWAIRYLIVDTGNWWPGKKVLISTRWIERISWEESKVFINLTRETIKQGPEYTEEALITRDYETRLHRHCDREGYWAEELPHSGQG
ncbi:MAG: PRC-barrel domain-containing protein [Bryobacteraceae bacterium]|nr:PRC-barrel domain-containing protein [Bryobacteraceae bacterium]